LANLVHVTDVKKPLLSMILPMLTAVLQKKAQNTPLCVLVLGAFPYRLIWTHSQCCY